LYSECSVAGEDVACTLASRDPDWSDPDWSDPDWSDPDWSGPGWSVPDQSHLKRSTPNTLRRPNVCHLFCA